MENYFEMKMFSEMKIMFSKGKINIIFDFFVFFSLNIEMYTFFFLDTNCVGGGE